LKKSDNFTPLQFIINQKSIMANKNVPPRNTAKPKPADKPTPPPAPTTGEIFKSLSDRMDKLESAYNGFIASLNSTKLDLQKLAADQAATNNGLLADVNSLAGDLVELQNALTNLSSTTPGETTGTVAATYAGMPGLKVEGKSKDAQALANELGRDVYLLATISPKTKETK